MQGVLISIQPKWVEKIASGEKTIEVRKRRPKLETPFKCYIYCTKGKQGESLLKTIDNSFFIDHEYIVGENLYGLYEYENGKVIGEFVCDEIFPIRVFENGTIQDYNWHSMEKSCIPYGDIANYIGNGITGYGWHISNLVIYDKPKSLYMFTVGKITRECGYGKFNDYVKILKRPPQSWCYVEVE